MATMPGFTKEASERMEAAIRDAGVMSGERHQLRQDVYRMQYLAMKWRFGWGVAPHPLDPGQPPKAAR